MEDDKRPVLSVKSSKMVKGISSFKYTRTPLWTASLLSRRTKLYPCIVTVQSGVCFCSQVSVMQTRSKFAFSTTCANSSIFGARDINLERISDGTKCLSCRTLVLGWLRVIHTQFEGLRERRSWDLIECSWTWRPNLPAVMTCMGWRRYYSLSLTWCPALVPRYSGHFFSLGKLLVGPWNILW